MTRRFLVFSAALLSVLLGTVIFHVLRPRCPINREKFQRISNRMTEQEVQDILGGPPRAYSSRRLVADLPPERLQQIERRVGSGLSRECEEEITLFLRF